MIDLYSASEKKELEIYNVLKQVIDPELGINIIDLGLIYSVKFIDTNSIKIKLTLSSKNCPMGDIIIDNVKTTLLENFPSYERFVELVWEPKWTSDFITPKGKKDLNQ